MEHVKFVRMKDGDRDDYQFLAAHESEFIRGTADRLLRAMKDLDETLSGYKVTRLEHSVQSATRAWRDGADVDWVVSALLHDIGDIFAPCNHDEYAATILKPYVREQCRWVVEKHGDFQLVYFGHHVGADANKRERHRGHRYFRDCEQFCERWDQASFDPDYPSLPLAFFEPMVREVFARTPHDPAVLGADDRPLVDPGAAAGRVGFASRVSSD